MEKKPPSQQNSKEIDNSYYPGKLIVIMNEFFNNQKINEKCSQNISYWESFVKHFFNKKCKFCIIMNQEGKQWIFNSGNETLPLIFKEKYSENVSLISVNMNEPYEYILNSEKSEEDSSQYLLQIKKFSKIEKYQESIVITNGILTVSFDQNLKINNYEFQSLSHKEYIIYYRGKIVGGIYDDRFLVKPTKSAVTMMPDADTELPYEGAKEMLLVDNVENRDFLRDLLEAMYNELPAVKKKK